VRDLEEGSAIYTVPWPSGQERCLIQLSGQISIHGSYYFVTTLSWSPDGGWLAFAKKPTNEPARIVRLSLETLEEQLLSSPPGGTLGNSYYPAFSPDGSQLAFIQNLSLEYGSQDIWTRPVGDTEAQQLTFEQYDEVGGLAWTPDGGEILFTLFWPRRMILRVSLTGGEPRPVVGVGEGAGLPSIRGRRMVYLQETRYPQAIWRRPGPGASDPDRPPGKLIASSGYDYYLSYSPDGRRIAFASDRGGVGNIWVCGSDGSNPVQLTDYASHTMGPQWSPDGRRIVFESAEAGDWNLYVIDSQGGSVRQLTHGPSDDRRGTWSHDGQWIYLDSDRSGERQIWKMPAEGGAEVQVTRDGGVYARESFDGSHLYYSKARFATGLWRVPVDGGEETEVFSAPGVGWALSDRGVYYTTGTMQGRILKSSILRYDLASGAVTELYRREGPIGIAELAVSPDEEWILYSEQPFSTSELMLVENFR
jgi:Tol biopolymer transport system component